MFVNISTKLRNPPTDAVSTNRHIFPRKILLLLQINRHNRRQNQPQASFSPLPWFFGQESAITSNQVQFEKRFNTPSALSCKVQINLRFILHLRLEFTAPFRVYFRRILDCEQKSGPRCPVSLPSAFRWML